MSKERRNDIIRNSITIGRLALENYQVHIDGSKHLDPIIQQFRNEMSSAVEKTRETENVRGKEWVLTAADEREETRDCAHGKICFPRYRGRGRRRRRVRGGQHIRDIGCLNLEHLG